MDFSSFLFFSFYIDTAAHLFSLFFEFHVSYDTVALVFSFFFFYLLLCYLM